MLRDSEDTLWKLGREVRSAPNFVSFRFELLLRNI